jgi:alpha-L-arabinofuranosidase
VTLFAVHRDQATPVALDVDVRSLPSLSAASQVAISGDDPDAVNTLSPPDRVARRRPATRNSTAVLQAVLSPLSLEHDPAVLATAVPGGRCMSF